MECVLILLVLGTLRKCMTLANLSWDYPGRRSWGGLSETSGGNIVALGFQNKGSPPHSSR